MRILSFGWTADRLLAGRKTVTRRMWKRPWVKPGELVQAWTKGPHRGGRRIGILKIVSVKLEIWRMLHFISDNEARLEGFDNAEEFYELIQRTSRRLYGRLYRIEFEPFGPIK